MNPLKTIVCIKQVPDPEGSPSAFVVDSIAKKVVPVGISPGINPFDANALEAALQLKDNNGGNVTAISMGHKLSLPVLRKALAVGADELILLEDEYFADLDSYSTALVLASAIKKVGDFGLIMVGRQAADWNSGQVGPIIAEILQTTSITVVQRVTVANNKLVAERLMRSGYEIVSTKLPAVVSVSSEIGKLRLPTLKAIKEARTKPVTTLDARSLGINGGTLQHNQLVALTRPPPSKRSCLFTSGESSQEKGQRLAVELKRSKVL